MNMAGSDPSAFGKQTASSAQDLAAALSQAVAHLRAGRRHDAAALCRQILIQQPDHPDALHLLGGMALQEGDAGRAVELIGRAAALDPKGAARFLDLAAAQSNLGDLDGAAESFERVLALQPRHVLSLHSLGQICHQRGDHAEAESCFRQALAIEPGRPGLCRNLGDSLAALGKPDEAAEAYRQALTIDPNDRAALIDLGFLERDRGRLAQALDCFQRAAALAPEDGATVNLIGIVQSELGETEAARAAYERAIALQPDSVGPHANLSRLHIAAGEAEAALWAAEGALKINPFLSGPLGDKGAALHELGRTAESEALFDYDRFVQPRRLTTPPGYPDLAAFNAALADALRQHPSLVDETETLSTRGGQQTREIFDGSEPFESLRLMIAAAVDGYLASFGPDDSHPITANSRRDYTMTGWGVILGRQGHQEAHMHDSARISGVYYVALPPGVGAGEGESDYDKAGWLEFGRCNGIFKLERPPRIHAVRPEEGLLVLFPSFFWHGTVPFESDEARISIAFDALGFA